MIDRIQHPVLAVIFSFSIMGLMLSCGPSNPDNTRSPSSGTEQEQAQTDQDRSDDTKTETQDSSGEQVVSARPKLIYYQMPG